MSDKKEKHPSYGMVSFSRVQSNQGESLFGSSIKHRNMVRMRVKTAYKKRDLNTDWYSGDQLLLEVDMSQNQFAELITSMNCGDGVPATLRFTTLAGVIEECPEVKVRQRLEDEFKNKTISLMEKFSGMAREIQETVNKKGTILKKDKESISSLLEHMKTELNSNIPFVQKQFNEATDKVVADAKGEIDATMTTLIHNLGVAALNEGKVEIGDRVVPKLEDIEI